MNRPLLLLFLLLGAWLGATVFMWQTAIQNFTVAGRLEISRDEGFRKVVGELPRPDLRAALRYQASEVNRLFFEGWGWVQIPLAAAAFGLAWLARAGWAVRILLGTMLAIAAVLAAYVVPETIRLGRLIDFAAAGAAAETRSMFWALHHSYTGLDMLKFGLGLAAAALSLRPRRPRSPEGA